MTGASTIWLRVRDALAASSASAPTGSVLELQYNFNVDSADNGNVICITNDTLYSLAISSCAPDGDILAANNSVNGNWTYFYDAFNRLVGADQNSCQSIYSDSHHIPFYACAG